MLANARDTNAEIVEKVLAQLRDSPTDRKILAETFVRQYYGQVDPEDLAERSISNLCGAALAHLNFINEFKSGTPKLRGRKSARTAELDVNGVKSRFEEAFARAWRGEIENDDFIRLVLRANLGWREVMVLRAYGKYLRQIGFTFSQAYMEQALSANPVIAKRLAELFLARFDPAGTAEAGVKILLLTDEIEKRPRLGRKPG